MHLEDYDTSRRYTATVRANTRVTPEATAEVRELVLEIEDAGFAYIPGQVVGVLVPGPHALGHTEHFRLYNIATAPGSASGAARIELCVKRCSYLDPYSGERYAGIASNYLCDRQRGDRVTLTGPYDSPFSVPQDSSANLLMIGLGTGIAPFRALVRHIYENLGGWQGKVRLFYGANTGLEMIYMNDERDDFVNYYDQATFEAFKALSPRPQWGEPAALDAALRQHEKAVWALLRDPDTYVYIAGHHSVMGPLEKVFSEMAGSAQRWQRRKAELQAGGRWAELLY